MLIDGTSQLFSTVDGKDTILYFVDVLPVSDSVWTYQLGAYLGRVADTTLSYELATWRSALLSFVVKTSPYTNAFCATVPAPDPTAKLPPTTWFNAATGMCEWSSSVAAQDAYCSGLLTNGTLQLNPLTLATTGGQACGALQPSFPELTTDWPSVTCSADTKDACLLGAKQQRTAVCNSRLKVGGAGDVNLQDLTSRLSAVSTFYRNNVGGSADLTPINTSDGVATLFNQYYHCDVDLSPKTWGTAVSGCNSADAACQSALPMASACGTVNKCDDWVVESVVSGESTQFSQSRACFPSAAEALRCCAHGVYVPSLNGGSCDCARTQFTGSTCNVDLCEGQTCSGRGVCGYVSNEAGTGGEVRCVCGCEGDTCYYNYDEKPGGPGTNVFLWPAKPNKWACNRNSCPTSFNNPECQSKYTKSTSSCDYGTGVCNCSPDTSCTGPRSTTENSDDIGVCISSATDSVNNTHKPCTTIYNKPAPAVLVCDGSGGCKRQFYSPLSSAPPNSWSDTTNNLLTCATDCAKGAACTGGSVSSSSCTEVIGTYGNPPVFSSVQACNLDKATHCGWNNYGCDPVTRECTLMYNGTWATPTECKCTFSELPMDAVTVPEAARGTAKYYANPDAKPGVDSHAWILLGQNIRGPWVDLKPTDAFFRVSWVLPPTSLRYVYIYLVGLDINFPFSFLIEGGDGGQIDKQSTGYLWRVETTGLTDSTLTLELLNVNKGTFVVHMIGASDLPNATVSDVVNYFSPVS